MALSPPRVMQIKKPEDSERAIAAVVSSLARVYGSDIVDGTRTEGIRLSVGSNQIAHKLGRQPVGWLIIDVTQEEVTDSYPRLYRTNWDSRILTLTSDAESTIALWVF